MLHSPSVFQFYNFVYRLTLMLHATVLCIFMHEYTLLKVISVNH